MPMTTSQPGHRLSSSSVLVLEVLVEPVQYSLRGVRNNDGVRDRESIMTAGLKHRHHQTCPTHCSLSWFGYPLVVPYRHIPPMDLQAAVLFKPPT